jgi:hypothetical protein
MHAVDLVTPEVIIVMIIGLVAFVVIFRYIFKDKR